jgi:uncharacterized protein with NAD-binding domain and iron-sulfur cluster
MATRPQDDEQEAVDVLVIGGGISGLTMAHELAERGMRVRVLEKQAGLGGKAISYSTGFHGLPGEHGIHFFPAFYVNFLDVLARIPLDLGNPQSKRVSDQLISLDPTLRKSVGVRPPMNWRDHLDRLFMQLGIINLGLMSERRSQSRYTAVSYRDYFDHQSRTPRMQHYFNGPQLLLAARADLCDALTICDFFFMSTFWPLAQVYRTLPAPTQVACFGPWRSYLENALGVQFRCGAEVEGVSLRADGTVEAVVDAAGTTWKARYFAFCVPVEALRKIVARNPALHTLDPAFGSLRFLHGADYAGLQLFLRGSAPAMHKKCIEPDHPWLLLSLDHSSYFDAPHCKGYTVISTVIGNWDVPGRFVKKPARHCTPEELAEEALAVLRDHFPEADFQMEGFFVDPTVKHDPALGNRCTTPLFVSHTGTFRHRPLPALYGRNLAVAGDYTRTTHVLTASMESACESGRRAAKAILDRESKGDDMHVDGNSLPRWVRILRAIDGLLFRVGLPNPLDLLFRLARAVMKRRPVKNPVQNRTETERLVSSEK